MKDGVKGLGHGLQLVDPSARTGMRCSPQVPDRRSPNVLHGLDVVRATGRSA